MFDHALKTNLKAVCIVVLYYSDGNLIKFPVNFSIYSENSAELIAFELKSGNKSYHLFKEFITDSVFFNKTVHACVGQQFFEPLQKIITGHFAFATT